jgi:hypothetical protein
MCAMSKLLAAPAATALMLALLAPSSAFAQASGEGLYGETNDKVVTNFGFILIIFFPTFILLMSLIQWRLDKRKASRKKAIKAQGGDERWRGGW